MTTYDGPQEKKKKKTCRKQCGKRRKSGNQHFSAFHNKVCFPIEENVNVLSNSSLLCRLENAFFVRGCALYQQYFNYFTATVHKPTFPGLFLTTTQPVHYPEAAGQS